MRESLPKQFVQADSAAGGLIQALGHTMCDLDNLINNDGFFAYSHLNLCRVNALGRTITSTDYRTEDAAIIDVENEFVHIFPKPSVLSEIMEDYFTKHKKQPTISDVSVAHCNFIAIHPFPDGNGRTARFIADINLSAIGFSPFLNRPIDRDKYYRAVRSHLETGNADLMTAFIRLSLGID